MIERIVNKALKNLLSLVATDTILKLRGRNGAILKKIFGHSDLISGAKLGDLHNNNLRQILCEIEINSSIEQTQEIEFLNCELSYLPGLLGATERNSIFQNLKFMITNDDKLLGKVNSSVEVFYVIQQSAESDLEIKKLIQQNDSKAAEKAQENQISLLKSVLEKDSSGMIRLLLKLGESTLKKLKVQGASKEMEKDSDHKYYMKRRGSFSYCEGYADFAD